MSILAAREVTKSNTWTVETFRSGELGYLGYADPDKVIFYRAPLRRKTLPLDKIRPRVDIVPFYGGADAKFIKGRDTG
jgi:L-asparaginase